MSSPPGDQVWMDQGGTFTDVVRLGADGQLHVEKVLSDRVRLESCAAGASALRRGTTVATNALLERRGPAVLLVTTAGLEEVAALGDQTRPSLFGLFDQRPPPLCARSLGLSARLAADGAVLVPLDAAAARAGLASARAAGCEAAAVVMLHGPMRPELERSVGALCREAGFTQVSLGHEISPSVGFFDRVQTTLADALTSPLLPRAPGLYLRSDGGLAAAQDVGWRGSQAVLSGPAGGAVAAGVVAAAAACAPAFGFDMGGTSTDVCRVDPSVERGSSVEVAGLRLAVPAVRLSTVAAGGGSLLKVEGGVYRVGPESAGARPGPACYGRGGPATVTDVEAALGRLPGFPSVCGPEADQALDLSAAEAAISALDPGKDPTEVALGFQSVAHEALARAVRRFAAERGVDPAAHALVAFGGAGPGHACGVARRLGIRTVLVPELAGVLSAVGVGLSLRRATSRFPIVEGDVEHGVLAAVRALLKAAPEWGPPRLIAALRYRGTDAALSVRVEDAELEALREPSPDPAPLRAAWDERFERAFAEQVGPPRRGAEIELVELLLEVEEPGELPEGLPSLGPQPRVAPRQVCAHMGGRWRDVPCLSPDDVTVLRGPAIVLSAGCTVIVEDGWVAERGPGFLRLRDLDPTVPSLSARFHPVHTAVFASRIAAVAEEMGGALARLARSVSIRERRDFSCAVFDAAGMLAVNAPHVPVHLGAMGETVRALRAAVGAGFAPGQAWVTNDPLAGGSHLPDITVMAPVFVGEGPPVAFVACRGHHVDVGGKRPGSMAPDARSRADEGLVLPIQLLAENGVLVDVPLPGCRLPDEVRADLAAQVACCARGVVGLERLVGDLGVEVFAAQLGHVQRAACWATEVLLAGLQGERGADDRLDDGSPLSLRLRVAEGNAWVRVEGPPSAGSLNAPLSVLRAALLYCFRALAGSELPLNEGALTPFVLEVNPGGLLDPGPEAAVAGGNVETSQRVVDLILRALGVCAGSQGTMNNLCIGFFDESAPGGHGPTLYETLAGGGGGGPGGAGLNAVQVHMTNTRATDVEVLERRFPLRLLRWARRWGSGGAGAQPGGDGTVKEWLILAPAEVCLLAGRRAAGAPGLDGGEDGLPGVDQMDQGEGWTAAPAVWTAKAGDRLRVATPGGGGWGARPA